MFKAQIFRQELSLVIDFNLGFQCMSNMVSILISINVQNQSYHIKQVFT